MQKFQITRKNINSNTNTKIIRNTNSKYAKMLVEGVVACLWSAPPVEIQIYANTNTDLTFDKMGQKSEEGEVGKARSCLLANTRITVGYTEKI